MRMIHTADWHLGRILFGVHLTTDQAYVLDQLAEIVGETSPDLVVVSGDVYDRALPPPDAVDLLNHVLSRLVLEKKTPVLLIAGNHDSPQRLGFGSRLLAGEGLHIFGPLSPEPGRVVLEDAHGPIHCFALPYGEPAAFRERLGRPGIQDHEGAVREWVERARETRPQGVRSVLIAHAFVVGGEESESERPLSVGGAGTVAAEHLGGFDYVALGHLHRPQQAGAPGIHYAGSILKYSFSEVSHVKSVNLVELDARGGVRLERIPLTPRRDLRVLEGTLKEVLDRPIQGASGEDYLKVVLHDREPVLDALGKLRSAYPNVLHLERTLFRNDGEAAGAERDLRRLGAEDLFAAFYARVTGEALTDEEAAAFAAVAERVRLGEEGGGS